MSQLTLSFLGRFQVTLAGKPLVAFESDRVRALLAYLAVEADRPHRRDQLAALFWPEHPEDTARANLRHVLRKLRQALGERKDRPTWLLTTRQTIQFNPDSSYTLDVARFWEFLALCQAHPHPSQSACTTCAGWLSQAVALYEGDFLAGLSLRGSIALEEWLLFNQELLHRQAMEALVELANHHESQDSYETAAALARRQVELEPWREESHRQLMRVLSAAGQRNAALVQYENCCRILAAELGVEPAPETTALYEKIRAGELSRSELKLSPSHAFAPLHTDWGEAPDTGVFYGRQAELARLERWLITDRCRLVAVLGLGGIGKTSLAAHLARSLDGQFDLVFWRSLLNAPLLPELLHSCLQFLAGQTRAAPPESLDDQLALLLEALRRHRCLLILDNLESVMQSGQAGYFKPGYETYGQLLRRIAQSDHQSCLLLTSREKPQELVSLAGDSPLVQVHQLSGVTTETGQTILEKAGLLVSVEESSALVERYSGNALALKLVAHTLLELFEGNTSTFLGQETPIFGDIREVLDEQFARLSSLEHELMVWLAVEREAVTYQALAANLAVPVAQYILLEALGALQRRSLLEKAGQGFTLQNVVMEYTTERLIEDVCREIEGEVEKLPGSASQGNEISSLSVCTSASPLNGHALLKAQAKEYVRQSQTRLIVQPIAERLLARLGKPALVKKLQQILTGLRAKGPLAPGYAAGNLLNLLLYLGIDISGYDFSQLSVWQAYLRGVALPAVNFAGANLRGCVFNDSFGFMITIALSPDPTQTLLAGGTDRGEIHLWRLADGQPMGIYTGHTDRIESLAFSPDGQLLASSSRDQTIRLWDVQHGQSRYTLSGHSGGVISVAFSPDGQLLASSSQDQTIRLWDVQSGQPRQTWTGHTEPVNSLAFSPDGRTLASGGEDHTIRLWDVQSGQLRQTWAGHAKAVQSVAFSPDGLTLASGSRDQTIRLWEVASGQVLHQLEGHTGHIWTVAFSPDGLTLASAGFEGDETIRLWDVRRGQLRQTLLNHDAVLDVTFTADGRSLVSAAGEQGIHHWDAHSGQLLNVWKGYSRAIRALAFSPDGQTLASGSFDQTVRLWEAHSGQVRATLTHHTRPVATVAFSPDGQTLASGSDDQTIHLWDMPAGQLRHTLRGHTNLINCLAFSPDGKTLASSSYGRIYLWDVTQPQGQLHQTLTENNCWIVTVAFSPDGRTLARGGTDKLVHLWDITDRNGQILRTLPGQGSIVWAVAFSPDGSLLAVGAGEGRLGLWDVRSGQARCALSGHSGYVYAVAFSPDGRLLASGGADRTIRLWDVNSGECLHIFRGHTHWVWSVVVSPEGQTLASSSADETIRLWDIATGACRQIWRSPGPYAGLNIKDVSGLTPGQIQALKVLGAVEEAPYG